MDNIPNNTPENNYVPYEQNQTPNTYYAQNPMPNTHSVPFVENTNQIPVSANGAPLSLNEFKDQSAKFKRELKGSAITCYVCLGISIVVSLLFYPIGLALDFVFLGLTLGMHLGKSKICATVLMVLSIINSLLSIALTGTATGIVIVIAGISAFVCYRHVEKEYKKYLSEFNNQYNNTPFQQ
ncbi:MAG: hypothetical protein IKB73_05900 [Ruminococcus sp.]|nr:hypothetical protein [Ruminococcus sp.]